VEWVKRNPVINNSSPLYHYESGLSVESKIPQMFAPLRIDLQLQCCDKRKYKSS